MDSELRDQTVKMCASLPHFASLFQAADRSGIYKWKIVRWENIDPQQVEPDGVLVLDSLVYDDQPRDNEFKSRTEALRFSDKYLEQEGICRKTKQRSEKGHWGVWRWKQGDSVVYQTVMPVTTAESGTALPGENEAKRGPSSALVRLPERAYNLLKKLALEEGRSQQVILDEAIREYDRLKFFERADVAYKNLRNSPSEWAAEVRERKEWDGTLLDDLDAEEDRQIETPLDEKSRRSAEVPDPLRGEIWVADLNPTRGHEQSGKRPVVVISDDLFNKSAAELVIVLPLTTRNKGIPYHVEILPPEGGVQQSSYIKCEDIRSIAKERLADRWGTVSDPTMDAIEYRLKLLLKL
jgi:mRNA interferase MazF